MGVRSTNLPQTSLADEVLVNRGGTTSTQPLQNLSQQLSSSGALADRMAMIETTSGLVGYRFVAGGPVAAATLANIPLTGEQEIDGVTTSNTRVLVKDQSDPAENGIYETSSGAWSRAADFDAASDVYGAAVFVLGGGENADKTFLCYSDVANLGQDGIHWTEGPPTDRAAAHAARISAESAAESSRNWAQGTLPGGPGTKSSREHSVDAGASAVLAAADAGATAADRAAAASSASQAGVYRDQAATLSAAAGAPSGEALPTLPDAGHPADSYFRLLLGPGVKIYRNDAGTWTDTEIWERGPRFDSVALMLNDETATYGGDGTIIEAGGYRIREVLTGDDYVNEGGAKLKVLPGPDGQYNDAAFGPPIGANDNIASVSKFLAARQTVLKLPAIERSVPQPKLHLISEMANGKNFQGFPAAVRHDGTDFILYREGLGHVETPPFGTKARLVCAVRPTNGIAPTGRTVIYAPTGIDPRDPNILRDDYGNAILVGGVFKVVMFEWAGDYTSGSASAKVFDLDPANIAAGLVNPVTIPLPVQAVKSDVRLLDNGDYAFIGYSIANTCYLVTTADWATFATEEIGPGNESAFCQTQDGALNVVARAEERFGEATTVFYKKPAGGTWYIHDVLPYTLNAPTLVKGQGIRVISSYPEGSDGWLLFARDKSGRTALTSVTAPISELVAFRSKESFGQTISKFTDRTTIMGTPRGGVAPVGDNHYCSVIAANFSGDLEIYTYAEFKTALELAATSFYVAVWRIQARFDGDQGVRPKLPSRRNYIKNGAFEQGGHGFDLTNPNIEVVQDAATGRNLLRVTDAMASNLPYFLVDTVAGETLFLKAKMRLNSSNLTTGRHVEIAINDFSTGSSVLLQTEIPELDPLDFGTDWVEVAFRPFVAPGNRLLIAIKTNGAISSAETDFAEIALSDDYGVGLAPPVRLTDRVVVGALAFGVAPTGGQSASGTYSSNIWTALGLTKLYSGLPMPAAAAADVTIALNNCLTQGGSLKCICTSATVNSDGSVSASFAVAPGETGTMGGTVTCLATATIRVP